MAVVLAVIRLVTSERRWIIDFDEHVASPARAVGLDVTDAFLDAAPVTAFRERLQGDAQA